MVSLFAFLQKETLIRGFRRAKHHFLSTNHLNGEMVKLGGFSFNYLTILSGANFTISCALRILTPQKWLFWGPRPLLQRFKPLRWRVQWFLGWWFCFSEVGALDGGCFPALPMLPMHPTLGQCTTWYRLWRWRCSKRADGLGKPRTRCFCLCCVLVCFLFSLQGGTFFLFKEFLLISRSVNQTLWILWNMITWKGWKKR